MDLKLRLQRVLHIVEEAERTGVLSDLERDIVLAELREAYSEVKFGEVECQKTECVNDVAAPVELPKSEPEVANESEVLQDDESNDEPEVEFEIIFSEEDEEEEETADAEETIEESQQTVAEEPIAEPEPVIEPDPIAEPAVEEEKVAEEQPIVNAESSVKMPHRSPILSLYEENAPVLGEQFGEKRAVGDTIACAKGVAESTPVASLREAIGVADKFMIIRELFDGDGEAYERAIDNLENIASLEDCVIYIAENYSWNAQSEGAKFVMELLQRKYNA